MARRKDPVAKQLREDPQFKQRVVPDHKKYDRSKERQWDWRTEVEDTNHGD